MKRFIKPLLTKLLPKSLLVVNSRRTVPVLYLTFDDGPVPGVTDQLLEVLAEYGVVATFFVIGNRLERHFELGQAVAQKGHSVGNHSYDHIDFGRLTISGQLQQANDADIWIKQLKSSSSRLFRAPQGRWNIRLLVALYLKGYRSVHWSYDSLDYSHRTADEIVENFRLNPVTNGDILLFHDDSPKSIDVLKVMLPIWSKQGFKFEVIR